MQNVLYSSHVSRLTVKKLSARAPLDKYLILTGLVMGHFPNCRLQERLGRKDAKVSIDSEL